MTCFTLDLSQHTLIIEEWYNVCTLVENSTEKVVHQIKLFYSFHCIDSLNIWGGSNYNY